jgi:hypothetical protein
MIFVEHNSLGIAPQLIALAMFVFNIIIMVLLYAHVSSTVPLVQVAHAHGTEVVGPMEITRDYGTIVATEFIKIWYGYTTDTFRQRRSYGLSFIAPEKRGPFAQLCGQQDPIVMGTKKAQRVLIREIEEHSFDAKVGLTLVFSVTLETYYGGLEYKPIDKRIIITLVNSMPDDMNPYLLKVLYLQEQQLTLE